MGRTLGRKPLFSDPADSFVPAIWGDYIRPSRNDWSETERLFSQP